MMKNFLILLVIVGSLLGGSLVAQENRGQKAVVRVYMIQDTSKDIWYQKNSFNLINWGPQHQGMVWTIKSEAKAAERVLFGKRKTAIKTFVLLPVNDRP